MKVDRANSSREGVKPCGHFILLDCPELFLGVFDMKQLDSTVSVSHHILVILAMDSEVARAIPRLQIYRPQRFIWNFTSNCDDHEGSVYFQPCPTRSSIISSKTDQAFHAFPVKPKLYRTKISKLPKAWPLQEVIWRGVHSENIKHAPRQIFLKARTSVLFFNSYFFYPFQSKGSISTPTA